MTSIPIIDAAELNTGGIAQLAERLGHACRQVGFFYLTGHGIPAADISNLFAMSHKFFALPTDEKARLAISATSANRGYVGLRTETLDPGKNVDDKEAFNVGVEGAGPAANVWPELAEFRSTVLDYFDKVLALGVALHRPIAKDLDLDPHFFDSKLDRPMATLRLLHYPPASVRADGQYGAGEHTDYGNLTLLLTDDAGGLEVRGLDGAWIAAPYIPGAFVCNIGDCLMRWTNDVYRSTPHRVINPPGRDRYSVAFFLDANADAPVAAVPSCVSTERPARYPPILAGDYLKERLSATYGFDAGKET
ncbi:2-oxoglutarate and iron-dependent oxygenase domain-containing protein [Roseiarcaceae bacterium H3SJ34-1]|uniref:isopenicillin N synthase family dioxygenase n=1 Tax=Terripilifer ovatus TaxID=3032367 RepID=UPI003AB9B60A|nr:2-oxoglutarate and iron-dependent oxygenase domain-containing protein [Roseiarcaceae bacterium H3SJ34-1]